MYSAISNDQAKSVINSEQLLAAYKDALAKSVEYAGGMHWKTIAGKQYLYRTTDGKGNAKSLGVRSEQTERILATFTERKALGVAREAELKDRLAIQAKVNSAYRVGHVPNNVADICICIELEKAHLLERTILIIGTNAMHAYEALGSVSV